MKAAGFNFGWYGYDKDRVAAHNFLESTLQAIKTSLGVELNS
jgi:hypothetical protein